MHAIYLICSIVVFGIHLLPAPCAAQGIVAYRRLVEERSGYPADSAYHQRAPRQASKVVSSGTPTSFSSTPSTTSTKSTTSAQQQQTPSSSDIQAYLGGHNSLRAQHGAKALTWSTTLAQAAQRWANNCTFAHSRGAVGPYGENLSAGTGNFTIAAGLKTWSDEAPQYNPQSPQASHYTQMVWKSTTELGCAVAKCNGIFDPKYGPANFYVCEYNPPGNVIGRFPDNVQ